MEAALQTLARHLPAAVKQQLEQLLKSLPASAHETLSALPEDLQRVLGTPEGIVLLFATALFGVLLLATLFSSGSKGKKRGSTVLLAGPMNSGKTTLFHQLRDGELHNGTVASMQENTAQCTVRISDRGSSKAVRLVDIPGHSSVRDKLNSFVGEAAAIVFLVDSVDVTPHRVEAAEMLYEILVNPELQRRRTPVLIACNKMDLEMEAHSKDFIRKTLEKQLDTMRKTKTAGIGKDAAKRPALGTLDKPFSFVGLRSAVTLCDASAKTGSLEAIRQFIVAST